MPAPKTPIHLGGPLGLAGLAMLAGATGIFVMAGAGGKEAAPATQEVADLDGEDRPSSGTVARPRPQPDTGLPMMQPAEVPATTQTREPAGTKTAQADTKGSEVVFIVRIKGEPEIDVISRNFKRDPAAAEIAWKSLQARHAVLKDFRLVGASYSGEIKLAYALPPGLEPTRATINDIQSRLMQLESVSYADPDYVAQAGKE